MKRVLIFPIFLCSLLIGNAYAACVAGAKTYTSCNAGYYLSGGLCLTCPSGVDVGRRCNQYNQLLFTVWDNRF